MGSSRTRFASLLFWGAAGICLLLVPATSAAGISRNTVPCSGIPTQLIAGQKLLRELGGGDCHAYRIALQANQFLHFVVDQRGIDVVLTIYSEDGTQLSKVDRPNGSHGPETISLIAPVDGFYLLNVHSFDEVSARGQYELKFVPPRIAQNSDKTRITAERLISEGEELRNAKLTREAVTKFQQAADVWRSLGNSYEEALSLYGAGFSCLSFGDNQAAIDYLNRALEMFVQLKNTPGEAMVKTALGWPYLYLSDLETAFDSFSQAHEIHRAEKNVRGEGISLYGLGWVYALRGDGQKALQMFSDSLICRRKVMDRRGEAVTLTGIAKVQSHLGLHSEALNNLDLALSILPESQRDAKADILSNLGWVHKALNENQKAMSFFNAALAIRREIGDLTGEATTRYGLSIVYRNTGRFSEAELEIEQALRIVESLRAKGSNQQLRISYFASVQDYYEFYITLLIELDQLYPSAGYAAKALHACERARARGLLDLLVETKIDLRQGVDIGLLERERTASQKLNALAVQQRQLSNHNTGATEATDKEIYRVRNELETARAEIRRLNARYAALTQIQPLTAAEIQNQVLDKDTLLLQYVFAGNRSFLLAATSDEITSYELPAHAAIENLSRQFYNAVTLRNRLDVRQSPERWRAEIAKADSTADSLARDLSRILLSPIKNKLTKQRLVLLTSGALQSIPFATLPIPSQSGAEVNPRLLIDDHELIVLPSVTALYVIRQEVKIRTPPQKTVIVLGDPVFDSGDSRVRQTLANPQVSPTSFPRLISARWEGEKISSLVPAGEGKLVVDFAANRNFASSAEVGTYRFVHFATHALIDFEHPALSGIVLSMVDQNGRPQNGFLGMEDIFKLKMPVDLVVLSGCRTALGKDYAGEGLIGLTRAFMYAGASRVTVSLWQVEDKSTSELMVRFYKYMLGPEKLSPSAALRAAQLDLRKDLRWRSPYFWAPFIIQGEWR